MSIAQFKDCPNCGEKIHVSKRVCPKCGRRKRLRWFHWVFIVLAGLFFLGAINGGENVSSSEKSSTIESETQRKFVEIAVSYKKIFKDAKNKLQQSSSRTMRRQALAGLGMGMHIDGWTGSIKCMETTSDGHAAIVVSLGSGIELHTWNNSVSDIGSGTLIYHDTALYNKLSNMERGQKIKFSGTFLPSSEDYYQESSLTLEGSMLEPEFLFKFTAINRSN